MRSFRITLFVSVLLVTWIMFVPTVAESESRTAPNWISGPDNSPQNPSTCLIRSDADHPIRRAVTTEVRALANQITEMKNQGLYDETLWDRYFDALYPDRTPVPPGLDQGGDICVDAAIIGALPFIDSGVTTGYNDDYDYSGSLACPWSSTSADVVYAYSPPGDEWVEISLCNSMYDTKLIVYEDVCDNSHIYACDDDGCGYYYGYTSLITDLELFVGHTYYIVVDGYNGDEGEYEIEVDIMEPRPINDDCEDAIPISCGTSNVFVDLVGATMECTNINEFPEVWYMFYLDPAISTIWDVSVSYCDSDPNMTVVSANLQNDCDCNDAFGWTSVSGTFCSSPVGLPEWIYFEGVPAGEWYLPIYNDQGSYVIFDLDCTPTVIDSCPFVVCTGTPEGPNDGGCLEPPFESQPITCGEVICGTATAVGGIRDTDWYSIAIVEPTILTWDVWYEYPLDMEIKIYDGMCVELYSAQDSLCGETIVTACLDPGLYFLYAAHQYLTGVPVPTNYRAKVSCAPCLPNPCPNPEVEPNDIFPPSQTITFGDIFCGVIESPYDQDKVNLDLPYRTAIEVVITGDGILHPIAMIFTEINEPIGVISDSTNTASEFATDFMMAEGTYVLNIMGACQTIGRYEVSVYPISLPTVAPPDPVVTLQAVGNDIELNWYQGYFNDEYLRIERADFPEGPWYELATIPGDQPSYLDTNPPSEKAFYQVIAIGERESNPFIGTVISLAEPDGMGGYSEVMDFEIQEMEFAADSLNRITISWLQAEGLPPNDDHIIDNDIRFQYGQQLTPVRSLVGHVFSIYGREMLIDHIAFVEDSLGKLQILEARGRDPKTDSLMAIGGPMQFLHPSDSRQGIGWWSGYPGFFMWLCMQHLCCDLFCTAICSGPIWAPFPCPPPNPSCIIRPDPNPNFWKVWCVCPGQPIPPPRRQMICTFKLYGKCKYYPCPTWPVTCVCPTGVNNCPFPQNWTRIPGGQRSIWRAACQVPCIYPMPWWWGWRWWWWWVWWEHGSPMP